MFGPFVRLRDRDANAALFPEFHSGGSILGPAQHHRPVEAQALEDFHQRPEIAGPRNEWAASKRRLGTMDEVRQMAIDFTRLQELVDAGRLE
jgi:hypothetical protein